MRLGSRLLPLVLLLIGVTGLRTDPRRPSAGPRQIISRNVTGLQLDHRGNVMEIVEERTCSAALVRLTCSSLTSFMFILEAEYQPNRTDACVYDKQSWCRYKSIFAMIRNLQLRRGFLRGSYPGELDENPFEFKSTINRRCAGRHHCRYRVTSDHPEALFWKPANIRIKYACVPEASVYKYCNADVKVPVGLQGGFLKSPGYPLYYLGGITCGWTFRSLPGQRIVLTFHDLSIREHERDGSCLDVVRVRDNGNTLLESCGSIAGLRIVSNTNVVTLNLVSSARLYPARGFFLQYQVLGCPDVTAPLGSRVSNGTLESRSFLCRAGTLFPDTGQRARTIHCRSGEWQEDVPSLPGCVSSSTLILRSDESDGSDRLQAAAGTSGSSIERDGAAGNLDYETRTDRVDLEDAVAKTVNYSIMDQTQPAMIKDGDYVVDVILPTLLIALLFVGNAVIVYIIFHFRKRKTPAEEREDIALSATANGATDHQV
ncbi:uncharacterized protein LOC100121107 isoform X2 [Nasonia vitripennis]|uniref:CUB domain-containing protein n=1 Tax=Nasonia vitripennis TaxID=7425 RepID=A0A7M7LJG9_NASVI|nr:uncharacterized protein LOC100121107 isoform X2 [Nasonia vitripennis]